MYFYRIPGNQTSLYIPLSPLIVNQSKVMSPCLIPSPTPKPHDQVWDLFIQTAAPVHPYWALLFTMVSRHTGLSYLRWFLPRSGGYSFALFTPALIAWTEQLMYRQGTGSLLVSYRQVQELGTSRHTIIFFFLFFFF